VDEGKFQNTPSIRRVIMPIPIPKTTTGGNADLGECIRFLRRENPEMSSDQRVAVCLNIWRKSKGKKPYKGGK
jgi:hypothetical protein